VGSSDSWGPRTKLLSPDRVNHFGANDLTVSIDILHALMAWIPTAPWQFRMDASFQPLLPSFARAASAKPSPLSAGNGPLESWPGPWCAPSKPCFDGEFDCGYRCVSSGSGASLGAVRLSLFSFMSFLQSETVESFLEEVSSLVAIPPITIKVAALANQRPADYSSDSCDRLCGVKRKKCIPIHGCPLRSRCPRRFRAACRVGQRSAADTLTPSL
jgi:hypothetical protein